MKYPTTRRGVIISAALISLLLYGLGVMSGLFTTKLIKQATEEDLQSLIDYVDILDQNLRSIQLDQLFTDSLEPEERCRIASLSLNRLVEQLGVYWERLPFRIEEFEKVAFINEQYTRLKQDYTQLSLRTWVIAEETYERCSTDLLPVLYFYSRDCDVCVQQGEELDRLQVLIADRGEKSLVFTVDMDAGELLIDSLQFYYNLTSVPAIIINDEAYQGSLFKAEDLLR